MTNQPKDPKPSDSQDKATGQIIAELSKFGGFNKEQSSRLARILLRLINQNYLPKTEVTTTEAVLEKLRQDMRMHTVPEGKGLITRSYLENAIDFEIAQFHKKGTEV